MLLLGPLNCVFPLNEMYFLFYFHVFVCNIYEIKQCFAMICDPVWNRGLSKPCIVKCVTPVVIFKENCKWRKCLCCSIWIMCKKLWPPSDFAAFCGLTSQFGLNNGFHAVQNFKDVLTKSRSTKMPSSNVDSNQYMDQCTFIRQSSHGMVRRRGSTLQVSWKGLICWVSQ